jgi:hypothetical protein
VVALFSHGYCTDEQVCDAVEKDGGVAFFTVKQRGYAEMGTPTESLALAIAFSVWPTICDYTINHA